MLSPATNPYAPGAGVRPPVLAGREAELADVQRVVGRLAMGYVESPRLLEGVRGVGKTVLLLAVRDAARDGDGLGVHVQARRNGDVVLDVIEGLDHELRRAAPVGAAADRLRDAIAAVRVSAFGVAVQGSASEDRDVDPVRALVDVLRSLADLGRPAVITVDEIQEAPGPVLSALLVGLQRAAGEGLPVGVVAAGLPGTQAALAAVESFAERMFVVGRLGPLDDQDARRAVAEPAEELGVHWGDAAISELVSEAGGYPFFLQHFAASTWDVATAVPIGPADVRLGIEQSERALDRSLVEARLGRLSRRERTYLDAMADLGPGPHRSGDVAAAMGTSSDRVGSARARLIEAGIVHSPGYGLVAFTVPLFDRLLRRRRGG